MERISFLPGRSIPPFRRLLALVCAALIVPGEGALLLAQEAQAAAPAEPPAEKLPADQLDSLVAPIALYPDPLLAQVLAASTYPLELVQLQQWLEKNKDLKDKALADAVAKQPWDPSVQSMAAVPDVVKRLADDIQWTTDLGNAFLDQQSDVMDAVQRMRKKAEDKGALDVERAAEGRDQGRREQAGDRRPAPNPEVVYVPSYNPIVVYPPPVYPIRRSTIRRTSRAPPSSRSASASRWAPRSGAARATAAAGAAGTTRQHQQQQQLQPQHERQPGRATAPGAATGSTTPSIAAARRTRTRRRPASTAAVARRSGQGGRGGRRRPATGVGGAGGAGGRARAGASARSPGGGGAGARRRASEPGRAAAEPESAAPRVARAGGGGAEDGGSSRAAARRAQRRLRRLQRQQRPVEQLPRLVEHERGGGCRGGGGGPGRRRRRREAVMTQTMKLRRLGSRVGTRRSLACSCSCRRSFVRRRIRQRVTARPRPAAERSTRRRRGRCARSRRRLRTTCRRSWRSSAPDGTDLVVTSDPVQDKNQPRRSRRRRTRRTRRPRPEEPEPRDPRRSETTTGRCRSRSSAGRQVVVRHEGRPEGVLYPPHRRQRARRDPDLPRLSSRRRTSTRSQKRDGASVNQYAQKVISSEGKQDGLAWRNADGTWGGPIGENVGRAIAEGYPKRQSRSTATSSRS